MKQKISCWVRETRNLSAVLWALRALINSSVSYCSHHSNLPRASSPGLSRTPYCIHNSKFPSMLRSSEASHGRWRMRFYLRVPKLKLSRVLTDSGCTGFRAVTAHTVTSWVSNRRHLLFSSFKIHYWNRCRGSQGFKIHSNFLACFHPSLWQPGATCGHDCTSELRWDLSANTHQTSKA